MLLLTADPLPPFMSLLLSFAHGIFLFLSFSQNSFLPSFTSSHHLSQNFTTHLLCSNHPLCCWWKMKVLFAIRGKRSPSMLLLPKSWVKRLLSRNRTIPGRRKGGHNPNSEFPPLIDPWYDAHIHFPVVPSDYSLPWPGRMWLSICHCATEVSWAPLASTITDLDIRQGMLLPLPILFKFRLDTSLG